VNASEWVKNLRLAGEVKPKGIKVLLEGSMLLVRSVKSNLFNKKKKTKNQPCIRLDLHSKPERTHYILSSPTPPPSLSPPRTIYRYITSGC
jgi:hypothetical protein